MTKYHSHKWNSAYEQTIKKKSSETDFRKTLKSDNRLREEQLPTSTLTDPQKADIFAKFFWIFVIFVWIPGIFVLISNLPLIFIKKF
jgi:hypothetical protein